MGLATKLLYFVYPVALSVFLAEAASLLWLLIDSSVPIPAKVVFEVSGGVLVLIALWQLLTMWVLRLRRVHKDLRKKIPAAQGAEPTSDLTF